MKPTLSALHRDIQHITATLARLQRNLNDYLAMHPHQPIDEMSVIIHAVADYFNVPAEDVIGPNRSEREVRPRFIAAFLIKELLNAPYAAMDRALKRTNNSSRQSVTAAAERASVERKFAEDINKARELAANKLSQYRREKQQRFEHHTTQTAPATT